MHLALQLAVAASHYLAAWRAHRQERATVDALGSLSEPLLHDIGIDRSDIVSIAAATAGRGDSTRIRTARSMLRAAVSR
jgi:uncharacterized protein YjiS (DUF1127 family)